MKKLFLLLILSLACVFTLTACEIYLPGIVGEPPVIEDNKEPNDGEETPKDALADAVSFLKQYYMDDKATTPSDYDRIGKIQECTVEWTINVVKGNAEDIKVVKNEDGSYTIDVNEKAAYAVEYVLTAIVTAPDGRTQKVEYNRTLPEYKVLSWDEYYAAENEAAVTVKGVVTAVLSKDAYGDKTNEIYLEDENGGYYVYALEADPVALGVKPGMTVCVTGVKSVSSYGVHEVVNGSVEILDKTIKTVTPLDVTELFKANALDAEALTKNQGRLVTLKGVTIGELGSNGYHYFALDGKETYLRISSSNCPLNNDDAKAFTEAFKGLLGHTANVTGVVSTYDKKFYLQPVTVDAVEDLGLPTKNDAEAVAWTKENLNIADLKFADGKTVELPLQSELYEVAIAWASSNADVIAINEGVATVVASTEDTKVTLTATLTKGEATDTVTFDVTVKAAKVVVPTTIELTTETLDLTNGSYNAGTVTVNNLALEFVELGYYENGIQMRNKLANNGNISKLWNTAAAAAPIKSIKLVYNAGKSTYDNADVLIFKFGNAANNLTEEIKLSTVAGTKEYTITPTGDYTFFSLEQSASYTYSMYWDSITIVFNESTAPETPVEPEHTCTEYTQATCEEPAKCIVCGVAKDNVLADHTYTDGVCSVCGAAEPTTDPETPETPVNEVVISIADYATANSWANSTLYESITADAVTVTATGTPVGTYGLNTGKYYTSDNTWRIYQNETPSVTITSTKTIASVIVEYKVKNSGTLTLNGENVASKTVVAVNGTTITFSVGNTGTAPNGQAQITSIKVIYA